MRLVAGFRHVTLRNRRDTRHLVDRKSTRLNSSHGSISYAVFCLKKKIAAAVVTGDGSVQPLDGEEPSAAVDEIAGAGREVPFFFNDTATTEIYTLSLHDALPIWFINSSWKWK